MTGMALIMASTVVITASTVIIPTRLTDQAFLGL